MDQLPPISEFLDLSSTNVVLAYVYMRTHVCMMDWTRSRPERAKTPLTGTFSGGMPTGSTDKEKGPYGPLN